MTTRRGKGHNDGNKIPVLVLVCVPGKIRGKVNEGAGLSARRVQATRRGGLLAHGRAGRIVLRNDHLGRAL